MEINLKLFEDKLNNFNKYSFYKIQFSIQKQKSDYDCNLYMNDKLPYIMPDINYYIFKYKIYDNQGNVEYNITFNNSELIEKAYNLSELLCDNLNSKNQIHNLIISYCYYVIEKHKNQSEMWNDYLINWDKHCYLSVYKTFEEAFLAREKFSKNLKDKIKEHLICHCLSILAEINTINKNINENNLKIQSICNDTKLIINSELRLSDEILYDYDFNE